MRLEEDLHKRIIGQGEAVSAVSKAIRRASVDIAYTGGFSPHQIMSFAAPLGVGITSDGEYFDIGNQLGYLKANVAYALENKLGLKNITAKGGQN